ncbi:MAG: DUF3874 domain-containing protein [Bacteroidales bacterium]|nr:DUF3874 domain-containing protein [Bacteroidales bacterium]
MRRFPDAKLSDVSALKVGRKLKALGYDGKHTNRGMVYQLVPFAEEK